MQRKDPPARGGSAMWLSFSLLNCITSSGVARAPADSQLFLELLEELLCTAVVHERIDIPEAVDSAGLVRPGVQATTVRVFAKHEYFRVSPLPARAGVAGGVREVGSGREPKQVGYNK